MYAIYGNIYHQYTPVMLAYVPYIRILWVWKLTFVEGHNAIWGMTLTTCFFACPILKNCTTRKQRSSVPPQICGCTLISLNLAIILPYLFHIYFPGSLGGKKPPSTVPIFPSPPWKSHVPIFSHPPGPVVKTRGKCRWMKLWMATRSRRKKIDAGSKYGQIYQIHKNCLLVWNIGLFFFYLGNESDPNISQLTFIFFRGVAQLPTREYEIYI